MISDQLIFFLGNFVVNLSEESCTFDMHLHLHLKKTLLDFGPAPASWCYDFERLNAILGLIEVSNHKSCEDFLNIKLKILHLNNLNLSYLIISNKKIDE